MRKSLLLMLLLISFASFGSSQAAAIDTDRVVLKHIKIIMNLKPGQVKINLPFAKQVIPGDALDIVEIILSIEEELKIRIDDKKLDIKAGAVGVKDTAQKLTIKQLQDFVKRTYRAKK